MFVIFGRFGHVQAAAFVLSSAVVAMFKRLHFLLLSAILAMFRQQHLYYFWPFWPCSGACDFSILSLFGHFQVAAFLLSPAVVATFRRPQIYYILGRFGHV